MATFTFPISQAPGTALIPATAIASTVNHAQLALDGTTASMLNPALNVAMTLDLSLDGGTTWASSNPGPTLDPFPIACTLVGGAGSVYSIGAPLPGVGNVNRQMRGSLAITGVTLVTTATLTVT